ncbi:MAG TPA: hypothetical protein VF030_01255 [Solirubrobacterales bacterium]
MPDGVDAAVDAVELAALYAIPYRPCPQASVFELLPRERTMLARGDSRHLTIWRVAFLTHVGT